MDKLGLDGSNTPARAQTRRTQMPYFRFYVDDFVGGTMSMSPAAVGHYVRLLCAQWKSGPIRKDRVPFISPGVMDCWDELEEKFEDDGTSIWNKRMEEEHKACADGYLRMQEGGRRGGMSRVASRVASREASSPPSSGASSNSELRTQNLELSAQNSTESVAAQPPAPTRSAKPKRSKPVDAIRWTADAGWEGISEADRAEWRTAYPACDIDRQLAAMGAWLKANPVKAHKSAWRKFVTNWLSRQQDRGGDAPSARSSGQPVQKVASW